MTDYLIDGEILGDIADAIREKTNTTNTITPENMASEIANIPSGVNPDNLATVDKVKSIDTWSEGVSELYTGDGISWREGYTFNNAPDLGGGDISNGDIYHRIPIVAGNGIEFENDGQLITINATGGGTSNIPQTYTVSSVAELPKDAVDGSIAFVMGYSIKGEWVFREEIEINVDGAFEVPCIINGYYYIGLFFMDDIIMGGLNNLPDDYSDWYEEGSWYNPRYIKFFADIDDDAFREFIHNNADRLSGGRSLYVREDGIWVYKGELT